MLGAHRAQQQQAAAEAEWGVLTAVGTAAQTPHPTCQSAPPTTLKPKAAGRARQLSADSTIRVHNRQHAVTLCTTDNTHYHMHETSSMWTAPHTFLQASSKAMN